MDFKRYNVGDVFYSNTKKAIRNEVEVEVEETLIYLGQDGKAFFVGHRQNVNNELRANFSEQLTYSKPLNEPTGISFRESNFTVASATNEYIEVYRKN